MEGSSDCTMSLSMWQRLTATSTRKTVLAAAGAGPGAAMVAEAGEVAVDWAMNLDSIHGKWLGVGLFLRVRERVQCPCMPRSPYQLSSSAIGYRFSPLVCPRPSRTSLPLN